MFISTIQANDDFVGKFVKTVAVKADRGAATKFRMAALRTAGRNFKAKPNEKVFSQLSYGF
jgi:hypothetical protein